MKAARETEAQEGADIPTRDRKINVPATVSERVGEVDRRDGTGRLLLALGPLNEDLIPDRRARFPGPPRGERCEWGRNFPGRENAARVADEKMEAVLPVPAAGGGGAGSVGGGRYGQAIEGAQGGGAPFGYRRRTTRRVKRWGPISTTRK
jgi:hypothetical protein